jgi:hypothetical protein
MTDITYVDFIDGSWPADTGTWNAAKINMNKSVTNSKLDKVGSLFISTVSPTTGVGVNGQWYYCTTTKLLHFKASGTWDAGQVFNRDAYDIWRDDGRIGPGGTNTVDDFLDSLVGPAGTFNKYDVSVLPSVLEDNALYLLRSSPAATSTATAGARTYTAAELLSGIIVQDCAGADRTDTLPTAAQLIAALTSPVVGQRVDCDVVNGSDADETITIAAGANGSFDPNQTAASRVIPQNTTRKLKIRITNAGAGTATYRVYL